MKKYFTLDEWIKLLQKIGKGGGKILTLNTLRVASGLSLDAAKKAVRRLGEKGYLVKLTNKFCANKFALPFGSSLLHFFRKCQNIPKPLSKCLTDV